ncbi:hypothetical protein [Streptomyces tropicalis]|uniref:Cysteinyl-tRNA synthetase n=1 Tax=Streptomyces tropicalis TaxID=3034234 RepID=A0ABT6A4M1_9ACTN|nr:hypothetical protein [Streptomyces tropicalis]MDF3299597.1 hypothetical protein [Streptomyces tropicalis]
MLRIIDARTGAPVEAAPARRGLTRIVAHASGFDASGLRVLLVADLLVRALEMGGTPVWALLTGDREQAELRAGAESLGIRPFEDSRDLGAGLGEAQAVHVVGVNGGTPDAVRIAVAPVDPAVPVAPALDGDPAVWRLALLGSGRSQPLRLDAEALETARHTLARWRGAVADWARRPSRPVPEQVRGRLRDAWEDDLDVPAVLRVLEWVETRPDLPDGARFETYAYADRLLGLDLARDVGGAS